MIECTIARSLQGGGKGFEIFRTNVQYIRYANIKRTFSTCFITVQVKGRITGTFQLGGLYFLKLYQFHIDNRMTDASHF